MSTNSLQQKIDDLEIRLSYQEDLLLSLNQRVAAQDKQIRQLQQYLQRSQQQWQQGQQRLDDMLYNLEAGAVDKPPHY